MEVRGAAFVHIYQFEMCMAFVKWLRQPSGMDIPGRPNSRMGNVLKWQTNKPQKQKQINSLATSPDD